MSSISKKVMAGRAQEFLPDLKVDYLVKHGIAGVRASVIDRKGNFIKEAIEIEGPRSYHITNYNSPGATGSPAFAAWLVNKLKTKGLLDHMQKRASPLKGLWNFEKVASAVSA